MSGVWSTVIKLIGMFLLAALGAELAAGIINGGGTSNGVIDLITGVIESVIGGAVALIVNLPVVILNFVIAILDGILPFNISPLPYITYP